MGAALMLALAARRELGGGASPDSYPLMEELFSLA